MTPGERESTGGANSRQQEAAKVTDLSQLPTYARSLLKIEVPVTVCLAEKRELVRDILELGPGSIIAFDKSCDDLLELCIRDCPVAKGEVVKVGDKFGLRIHQMLLPQEQFAPARKNAG